MQPFIANLTFPRKFALIGLLALLLLAVPATLLFKTLAGTLADAEQERRAIAPAAAVLKLVQLTQQHRGLTAGFLAGQIGAVAPRQAKQLEVDAAWGQLHQALAAFGDARLQRAASSTAEAWAVLAQAVPLQALQAPQSFARHTALVAQQLGLLQALAVESGIARHHAISGYHLQLAVLGQLPRLSESMGQLRARANAVLVRGQMAVEDRLRLEALLAQTRQLSAELKTVLVDLRRVSPAESQRVESAAAAVFSAAEQVLALAETDIIKADTLSLQAPLFWARITQAIDQQFDLSKALFAVLDEQIAATHGGVLRQMALVGATVLALAAWGAWLLLLVALGVLRSVRQAVELTQAVAAGDLSTPMPPTSGDELGQLLQALARMQQGLSAVVGSVRHNAYSVATASAQIAQGNQDLSSRTEEQASALQQTAATMDELGSTVRNNADNSRQADELALGAASVAIKGGEMVNQVVQTMRGINESSCQIAEIVSVIDSIAFQTNILALNAAVEAARAGEQGRGFAVVASEVRTLAQRSAHAARQIKALITISVQRVEQGTALVDEAGQAMQGIVAAIDRVKSVVAEISNASVEQSLGVTQVGQAVTQMDKATQRNAALVEQSAAAAESLREQAQALVSAVSTFRLAA